MEDEEGKMKWSSAWKGLSFSFFFFGGGSQLGASLTMELEVLTTIAKKLHAPLVFSFFLIFFICHLLFFTYVFVLFCFMFFYFYFFVIYI
jgi:hypothetical protein